jgi:hypothetical protein
MGDLIRGVGAELKTNIFGTSKTFPELTMGSFENLGYPIPKVTLKGQNLWNFPSNGCRMAF